MSGRGFIGRRNPTLTGHDPNAGPKYLNTPTTLLFHKGDQLYGAIPELLAAGGIPVLGEGPMDAHAVTLATRGTHVGVSPLGTALTETQAAQLARYSQAPIVATDADPAGRLAAERDHWLLSQHGLTPMLASFPTGSDPADLLERRGPAALQAALHDIGPLAEALLHDRLNNPSSPTALHDAVTALATHPPRHWDEHVQVIASRLDLSPAMVRQALLTAARTWHQDPRHVATARLNHTRLSAHRTAVADAATVHPPFVTPGTSTTAPRHTPAPTLSTTRGPYVSR